jgi:hypothetical protein
MILGVKKAESREIRRRSYAMVTRVAVISRPNTTLGEP